MPLNDVSSVKRAATRDFLEDRERVDELLERFAQGDGTLKQLCEELDLVYPTTLRFLAKHYREDYESAKAVRADLAIDEMAEVERDLLNGDTDFNTAREALKSKQWRAERLNPGRYSPKQTVDMQVTDKTKLHLAAIRELARTQVRQLQPAPPAQPALTKQEPQTLPAVVDAVFVEAVSPNRDSGQPVPKDTESPQDT